MPKSARSSHRRKKVVHRRLPAAVYTPPVAAPSSAPTASPSPVGAEGGQGPPAMPQPRITLVRDYSHVKQDLLRIAVIAAFLLIVLAVVTLLAG